MKENNEIEIKIIYNEKGKTLTELMQEWIKEKVFFGTFSDSKEYMQR